MLQKIGSSMKHQPSTQYPCTSPHTTRDEPWFGELKFSLGVKKGLPVTERDCILRWSPPVVRTMRVGPSFRKMKGPNKSKNRGLQIPHSLGTKKESTSQCDTTFSIFIGKE